MAQTLAELRDSVMVMLDSASVIHYPVTAVNRAINIGERDVAAKTLCLEDSVDMDTQAGERILPMTNLVISSVDEVVSPEGAITEGTIARPYTKVLGVEYIPSTGKPVGLPKMLVTQLGHMDTAKRKNQPQWWFSWGRSTGIEPVPDSVYHVRLWYAGLPAGEMSDDTDTTILRGSFAHYIVQYAYYRMLIRDKRFASAAIVYKSYLKDLQVLRNTVVTKYAQKVTDFVMPDRVEAAR